MVHPPRFERGTLSSEVILAPQVITAEDQKIKAQIDENSKSEISPEVAGTSSIFPNVPETPRYANATQSENAPVETSETTSAEESNLTQNPNHLKEGEGAK